MKKILPLCLAAVLCILLTACVAGNKAQINTPEGSKALENGQTAEETPVLGSPEQEAEASQAVPEENVEPEQSEEAEASSGVVAESSNAVSDKEKQKILDDLSDQLDSVLGSLEDLEDLDESDLNTNGL